jgi:cytochrome c oxidase subunit II
MAMNGKVILLAPLLLGGCAGWQSALDPHSDQAAHLANLFWFFGIVCAVVWLLVMMALAISIRRRRNGDLSPEDDTPSQKQHKMWIVGSLVVVTAVILTIFTLLSFYATRDFAWANTHALTIKVTGQQWWWQIEYQNEDPAQFFTTANEIHIPVGKPVTLQLEAADVIHSFWVPNLMGKQDMIPGRRNLLTLQADRPGLYRGQCAEFCGLEHAKMAILVFAEPHEKFEVWRRRQIEAAATPGAPQRVRGMQIFIQGPCAVCHTVTGTDAGGHTAPDLTHFGGRATIAAGLLHNTPENLGRWLDDPQTLKPGSNMPKIDLSQSDRAALVAYLEGLK